MDGQKNQYARGADIGYQLFIYDFKQLERRIEAAEREEKYQNAIKRAAFDKTAFAIL